MVQSGGRGRGSFPGAPFLMWPPSVERGPVGSRSTLGTHTTVGRNRLHPGKMPDRPGMNAAFCRDVRFAILGDTGVAPAVYANQSEEKPARFSVPPNNRLAEENPGKAGSSRNQPPSALQAVREPIGAIGTQNVREALCQAVRNAVQIYRPGKHCRFFRLVKRCGAWMKCFLDNRHVTEGIRIDRTTVIPRTCVTSDPG